MKKYIFILFSLLFCACSENEILNTVDSVDTPEDSIITVKLNIMGDVQTSETPLTRAETESTDVMGIIVTNGNSNFVFGLFDCWDNLSFRLKAGTKYNFYCTMITDAKNKLSWSTSSNHKITDEYPFYFFYSNSYNNTYHSNDKYPYVDRLKDGRSVFPGKVAQYNNPIERFYGEVTDYTPTVDGVIDLPLKRVSFGLKVKVSGITDGSVSVTCKNNYKTFYSNSNITSNIESEGQLFSMYNIYDAWQYADADYQEAVSLSVVWTRGNGIVQDLGTKTAYVKRNVMNIIKVRLSKNDTDVDVDVDPEEGDMGGEEEDLSN